MVASKDDLITVIEGLSQDAAVSALKNLANKPKLLDHLRVTVLDAAGSPEKSQAQLVLLKSEMEKALARAKADAEAACCGKWHLLDEANPVCDAVADMLETPREHLDQLTLMEWYVFMAECLTKFEPDGKIYDFKGSDVVNDLNRELCKLLEGLPADEDLSGYKAVLTRIGEVFSNKFWKSYQDYGLFDDIQLSCGDLARKLLQPIKQPGAAETPAKKPRLSQPKEVIIVE
eukprot:jgi/Mesvir1/4172/Mv17193-RA.1